MLIKKIYFGLWLTMALVAALLWMTGGLTMLAVTVMGFVSMPLIFMGMMLVVPIILHEDAELAGKEHRAPISIWRLTNLIRQDWGDMTARRLEIRH